MVPRMWGGLYYFDELRAIANAGREYKVPTVISPVASASTCSA